MPISSLDVTFFKVQWYIIGTIYQVSFQVGIYFIDYKGQ